MLTTVPVLTIDGPSGSGKGTLGQQCAQQLGWHYLDSGAVYRALAWAAQQQGLAVDDETGLVNLADNLQLRFLVRDDDSAGVEVQGKLVNEALRTEEVGAVASQIASLVAVREALLDLQRRFQQEPGLVADGRDMGTTVFPDAEFKVYLTASAEVRAQRRYDQLQQKGFDVSIARLLEAIQERDARDSNRSASPLKPAADAIVVDTSELSIDQVKARILDLVQQN